MTWKMYASKQDDGTFRHIFMHPAQVKMCSSKPVSAVLVRERLPSDPEPLYWAWISLRGYPTMIQRSYRALNMCFPYGIDTAIKANQGYLVNLVIEEEIPNPKD